jgi:hypothetical protein
MDKICKNCNFVSIKENLCFYGQPKQIQDIYDSCDEWQEITSDILSHAEIHALLNGYQKN